MDISGTIASKDICSGVFYDTKEKEYINDDAAFLMYSMPLPGSPTVGSSGLESFYCDDLGCKIDRNEILEMAGVDSYFSRVDIMTHRAKQEILQKSDKIKELKMMITSLEQEITCLMKDVDALEILKARNQ